MEQTDWRNLLPADCALEPRRTHQSSNVVDENLLRHYDVRRRIDVAPRDSYLRIVLHQAKTFHFDLIFANLGNTLN